LASGSIEALNKKSGTFDNVYSFQEGTENEAQSKWLDKGIQAIAYDSDNRHSALWETLAAWAERAKSPENWYQSIIRFAQNSPAALQPFQRGQVAHLVSTLEGARLFANSENVPPAEWLCVFDSCQRYAKPSQIINEANFELGKFFNPFQHYALDSDSIPQYSQSNNHNQEHEIPTTAWDAFTLNSQDRQALVSNFRGYFAQNVAELSARLWQLSVWLGNVVDQSIAVWWAGKQIGLHPVIQRQIEKTLNNKNTINPEIQRAWHYLFEVWQAREGNSPFDDGHQKWYSFKIAINNHGWNDRNIRLYAKLNRPYLCVTSYGWRNQQPPVENEIVKFSGLLNIDVQYRQKLGEIHFPDEQLVAVIRELRKNLEYALQLEMELDSYQLQSILSIYPETDPSVDKNSRIMGLCGHIIYFSQLFERLSKWNIRAAQEEFAAWPIEDETIFARLRIWAIGIDGLICDQAFVEIMLKLSEGVFWNSYGSRDLLLTLARRWNALSTMMKKQLEMRLLSCLSRYQGESEAEYREFNARIVLNRLHWLAGQGCQFTFDLCSETQARREYIPSWTPQSAKHAADSMGIRCGTGRKINETFSELLLVNLADTLAKALELTGRSEDFTTNHDPYSGLCKAKPVRAFSALTRAAKNNEFPKWAWESFFYSLKHEPENSVPDSALIRFWKLIIERIARYSAEHLIEIIYPITYWLHHNSKLIAINLTDSYQRIMIKLVEVIELQSVIGSVREGEDKQPNWIFEAINSPAGYIVEILMNDPKLNDLTDNDFSSWLLINKLLALSGDLRRYVLVVLVKRLNWFFFKNPHWTEENLLAVLAMDNYEDKQAFWGGFLMSSHIPNQALYNVLKQDMLSLIKDNDLAKRGHERTLVAFILAGWGSFYEGSDVRCVSDEELRSLILQCDDEFRSHLIEHLEFWSKEDGSVWKKRLPALLGEVWPLQLAVKTPVTTERLVDLAFSDVEQFEAIADLVPRLLGSVQRRRDLLLYGSAGDIIDAYPSKALAIIYKVFAEVPTATDLPYDLEQVLERMTKADVRLKKDKRWLCLKRKLHG
jgi:hypothetical protein